MQTRDFQLSMPARHSEQCVCVCCYASRRGIFNRSELIVVEVGGV